MDEKKQSTRGEGRDEDQSTSRDGEKGTNQQALRVRRGPINELEEIAGNQSTRGYGERGTNQRATATKITNQREAGHNGDQ